MITGATALQQNGMPVADFALATSARRRQIRRYALNLDLERR